MPVGGGAVYYALQRTFGLLRDPDRPLTMLRAAARLARELRDLGFDLRGKRIMEVGTGWRVDMPVGLFLCGTRSIETFDRHKVLKPHLVMDAVAGLAKRREMVFETFAGLTERAELEQRLEALLGAPDVRALFRVAGVTYHAPADATRTGRPDASVDLHMSYTVLQLIPYETLVRLLREASRVLSPDGLAWHHIDLADPFAGTDPSISRANFVRFTDAEWEHYAGNRFAYHNRLRVADYERLYQEAEHEVVRWVREVDPRSRDELAAGFPLADRFHGLPTEVLATHKVRVVSRPMR